MGRTHINLDKEALAAFCRQNHIVKLALFGSVLRDDFSADSDVDVLVEFAPGHVPGYGLIRMQDELSRIFGNRAVDLVTPKFLNRHFRNAVLANAVVQYDES